MSKQFKITIKKYFEIKGKNSKKTTIDHSILFDPLVDELPNSNKWLLIVLIMIAGEHGNATVTLSERRVNELLKTKEGAENALLSLQQYQVLSYERMDSKERKKVSKEFNEEKETVLPVLEKVDLSPQEQKPSGIKYEDIFSNKVKFREWELFLREKNIYSTSLAKGIGKLSERFETVDSLREFIESVLSSPKTQAMNKIQLRRYVQGALINEAGIR